MNYLEIIPSAMAQQQAAQGSQGIMSTVVLFGGMFFIMYFLMIRPQKKREQEHQKFVESIQKGDEVVTQSGLLGKVVGVADKVITLEVAPNVKIKVLKPTVVQKVDQALTVAANQ